MLKDSSFELPKRPWCIEGEAFLLCHEPLYKHLLPWQGGVFVRCCDSEAPPVDSVESDVDDLELRFVQDVLDIRERVILDVLVTDCVVSGRSKHRGHI